MHSKDCDRSLMLVVQFGKNATVSVFFSVLVGVLVCLNHNQSGYLAFRTTKDNDKKLTPKVFSILSRMKQLFKFFSVTDIRHKSCRVFVPGKIYNSLAYLSSMSMYPLLSYSVAQWRVFFNFLIIYDVFS